MKMYEALDMNGMPIENCPSTDEVAVQQAEPSNKSVKLWVVPSYERVIEIEVPVEGSETGETTTETYTETVPASILYRGPDGKLHNMDSIAGAPGTDGVSPTVKMEELLGENGEKIGVSLSIADKDSTKSVNILDGAKGEKGDSGKGIIDIVKTGSAGNVDTYAINFTDGTSTTFTVSNGRENEKTSQLENDSGFITKFVTDLANYYTKNETLSTTEITALIEQKANGERVIVEGTDAGKPDVNPEDINPANTYLVKTTNGYSMWAWISNDWARLGDTDINLSGYYTMGQTDAKFATKAELEPLVKDTDLATVAKSGSYNDLADKPSIPSVDGLATVGQVESKVQEAQKATEAKIPDASQFRKKTDAIQYSEISGTPVVDTALSTTSTNAVQNKVVVAALNSKNPSHSFATSTGSVSYVKIPLKYQTNGPSPVILLTSRSGEIVMLSIGKNDNNYTPGLCAARICNRYSKIDALYFDEKNKTLWVKIATWANYVNVQFLRDCELNGTISISNTAPDDLEDMTFIPVVDAIGAEGKYAACKGQTVQYLDSLNAADMFDSPGIYQVSFRNQSNKLVCIAYIYFAGGQTGSVDSYAFQKDGVSVVSYKNSLNYWRIKLSDDSLFAWGAVRIA